MKLAEHNNTLKTNVQSETQNFGIGDASVVIEILRNRLYEHKIRTLVQEYMCNARDAMREVNGVVGRIEVTAPTVFSPMFKVRDFGPGISPDRMANVFVMYGASTKRKDNTQTGGFGIGAKSAWSYTDSFNIVTYVDGTKRTYIAHTGVNNNGRLDLISTEVTKEPNGTEIQVAVKPNDVTEFVNAIFRASYFWEQRPTYKGVTEIPNRARGIQLTKDFESIRGGQLADSMDLGDWHDGLAVIDGVPYVLTSRLIERIAPLRNILEIVKGRPVFYLPNGVVEVSASREAIADSQTTIRNLTEHAKVWLASLQKYISEHFKAVKDVKDFVNTYKELSGYFHVDQFSKYGDFYASDVYIQSDVFKKISLARFTRKHVANGERLEVDEVYRLRFDELTDLFFLNAGDSKIRRNKRIREYLKTRPSLVVMNVKENDAASFDRVKTIFAFKDLTTVQYVEPPKIARVKVQRDQKEFCVHTLRGDRFHYLTLASNTIKWLYVPLKDGAYEGFNPQELRELDFHLRDTAPNVQICGLAPRALAMVKGEKAFQPLTDWLAAWVPTPAELGFVCSMEGQNADVLRMVAVINKKYALKDGLLKSLLATYENFTKIKPGTIPEMLKTLVQKTKGYKDFMQNDAALTKRLKEYPLLTSFSSYSYSESVKEDMAFYLNEKFATIKKEGN